MTNYEKRWKISEFYGKMWTFQKIPISLTITIRVHPIHRRGLTRSTFKSMAHEIISKPIFRKVTICLCFGFIQSFDEIDDKTLSIGGH